MKAGIRGILILIEQSWLSFMEREKGRVSSSKYLIKYILSLTKLYSICDFVEKFDSFLQIEMLIFLHKQI